MSKLIVAFAVVLAGLSVAAAQGDGAAKDVAVTDPAVLRSPYNWSAGDGGAATTNNPGAYLRARFTGGSVALLVDASANAQQQPARRPAVAWHVDDGPWQRRQLDADDTVLPLASGLAAGTHELEVVFVGVWWQDPRWAGGPPPASLTVRGLRLDPGGDLAPATPRPRLAIVYGDSNSEGYEALASGVTVANQDAGQATPLLLGRALDAEVGVVAFAGQGYVGKGGGGVPPLAEAWDHYWQGHSRLVDGKFDPQPGLIINLHGQNDRVLSKEQVAAQVAAWRKAAPDALIVLASPANLQNVDVIKAGAATDARAVFVTTGENLLGGKRAEGAFNNHGHLSVRGHARYAAALAAAIGRAAAGE